MYVCGITPYDATHLGHAATYLLFDELQRVAATPASRCATCRTSPTSTTRCSSAPCRPARTGPRSPSGRRSCSVRTWRRCASSPPTTTSARSRRSPTSSTRSWRSKDTGAAYELDGDTYFSVAAAPRLRPGRAPRARGDGAAVGRARRRPAAPGQEGPARLPAVAGAPGPASRPGTPRSAAAGPGWHVECAAIALKHLGTAIDVQGGGDDLVFPHHELSAAEAEVITGAHPFAQAYVHQAMVGYDGEKMSKSKGNLVLVSTLRAAGRRPDGDPAGAARALAPTSRGSGTTTRSTRRSSGWGAGARRSPARPGRPRGSR